MNGDLGVQPIRHDEADLDRIEQTICCNLYDIS